MFVRNLAFKCSIKCNLPNVLTLRAASLTNRKKYVRRKPEKNKSAIGACLQVIGSGAADQPASVLLNLVDSRYLFNCGEGTSRLSSGTDVNLKKIDHAFFTQSKWSRIGGVTNLMFATIAHLGHLPTIHGPDNLFSIFQRMSNLSILGGMFKQRFNAETFRHCERFEDNKVIIQPVKIQHLDETACVFVCKLKKIQGRFSITKAVNLNVPNDLILQIHRGEDVTLDDGTVVTAKEVRHPDTPEATILFVDVPHEEFLDNTANVDGLKRTLHEMKTNSVDVLVHFTSAAVFDSKRYQTFIEQFDAKKHLLLNDKNNYASMKAGFKLQQTLHKIDPKLHPLLSMKLDPNPLEYKLTSKKEDTIGKTPALYTKFVVTERPSEESFNLNEEDDPNLDEINQTLSQSNDIYTQTVPLKLKNESFPRILFLGTGSASSDYLRSSSAILVHLSKNHSFLLDCGSGTAAQINRFYGDEAPEIFRRLRGVFVSHMHLDHHIGLPEMFRWRKTYLPASREPLRLFCPFDDLKAWLLFYSNKIEPIKFDVKFINNDELLKNDLHPMERHYLNIDSMVTCDAHHYRKSYAVAMTFSHINYGKQENFKLAYSGDIGQSGDFVKIGAGADLLIHEATFQDELIKNAKQARHSTFSMALEQSKRMRAKHTILTHFSQRYSVLPYINENADASPVIAFDYMEVTPQDLPRLSSLLEQYKKAFRYHTDVLKQKTRNYISNNRRDAHFHTEV